MHDPDFEHDLIRLLSLAEGRSVLLTGLEGALRLTVAGKGTAKPVERIVRLSGSPPFPDIELVLLDLRGRDRVRVKVRPSGSWVVEVLDAEGKPAVRVP